jgi:hypothetical protein
MPSSFTPWHPTTICSAPKTYTLPARMLIHIRNNPVYALHFIQTPPPADRPGRKIPDFVVIHLLLLRLKEQGTDIMITINSPHYPGEYEKPAEGSEQTQLMQAVGIVKEKILETLEVKDWGLFQG